MRRALSAALFSGALLLLGPGTASADPGFRLIESEAGAGDVVHFSISDTEKGSSYTLALAGREVAQGRVPRGDRVSGAFTMPDLGGVGGTVSVVAAISEHHDSTTLSRTLRYLAPAPVAAPIEARQAIPPAPPGVIPPAEDRTRAAPPAEPPRALPAGAPSAARDDTAKRPARRPHRKAAARRTSTRARRRNGATHAPRRARRSPAARTRARRPHPRTAPLFDGVPEAPSGPRPALTRDSLLSLNAIAPPAAPAPPLAIDAGAGPSAAVLVPALLGVGALLLAGTALVRARLRPRRAAP